MTAAGKRMCVQQAVNVRSESERHVAIENWFP